MKGLFAAVFALVFGFIAGNKDDGTCISSIVWNFDKFPIDILISNSPYTVAFTLSDNFLCANVFVTAGKFNSSDSGYAVITNTLNTDALVWRLVLSEDQKSLLVYNCTTDDCKENSEPFMLYLIAYASTEQGTFFCLASCDDEELDEFICFANSNNFPKEIQTVVKEARELPNGQNITWARLNCHGNSDNCQFLNLEEMSNW